MNNEFPFGIIIAKNNRGSKESIFNIDVVWSTLIFIPWPGLLGLIIIGWGVYKYASLYLLLAMIKKY